MFVRVKRFKKCTDSMKFTFSYSVNSTTKKVFLSLWIFFSVSGLVIVRESSLLALEHIT